jgi:hypothetical protein
MYETDFAMSSSKRAPLQDVTNTHSSGDNFFDYNTKLIFIEKISIVWFVQTIKSSGDKGKENVMHLTVRKF